MRLDKERFEAILGELVDENPFAIRPALKILGTRFTDEVPTLAVTLEERPELQVNLGFLKEHCESEAHVKACVAHEFLHVLLGHTERFKTLSRVENLALDAVINAIVHRTMGNAYSSFFALYYSSQEGLARLLRPMSQAESAHLANARRRNLCGRGIRLDKGIPDLVLAWEALYEGKLVADDILELARQMLSEQLSGLLQGGRLLIGNHDGIGAPLPDLLAEALEECMRQMNGDGIWRSPKDRGIGAHEYQPVFTRDERPMELWRRRAFEALKKSLVPDSRSQLRESVATSYRVPVLSPRDRRAFLRAMWSPVLPEADWASEAERPLGYANVYLDVSGSMNAEMPLVIELLWQLRKAIRMPFWAFSTEVRPARIERGQLVTSTTGGTSMNCVLAHLVSTRPQAAVVVTDGYIERVDQALLNSLRGVRLSAVVTRDGSPAELHRAGIPYTQLERLPNG
ncbi:MAG TPA: vWA domain-containing protein [Vulgatibacter sp.]